MRRSFAPSFQSKKNIPVKLPLKEVSAGIQNSARSTSSILDLLNDSNCASDSNTDFSKCQENDDQESKIKVLVDSYNDDIDGNLPEALEGTAQELLSGSSSRRRIYNVVWGKLSKKKHKSWEGDGVVEIGLDSVVLKDSEGKCLGTKRRVKTDVLEEGSRLVIGGKEVELIDLAGESIGKPEEKEKPLLQTSRISSSVNRPHKRPRFSISKSQNIGQDCVTDALVMSTPTAEHQKTSLTASTEDDIDDLLSI